MKGKKVDAGDQVGLSRRVLVPRFWFSTLKGSFIFPPIPRPVAPPIDPERVVLSAQGATLDYLKEGLAANQDQSTFKISA